MDASLFIGILSVLSAFYIFLGWYASRGIKNHVDFFLAGKSLGLAGTTGTLLATQIGGGMFIGTAEDPFRGALYIMGIVLSFLIFGFGVAEKFRALNVETVSGIFKTYYKSLFLKKVCAILSVITLCGVLLSQTIAMQSVISNFSGGYTHYIFPVLWTVIVLYSILGGLKAVMMVDFVQILFVIIVFSLFFFYGLSTETIPFFSKETISELGLNFLKANLPLSEIIKILTVSTCYSLITQDIAQRFFATGNTKIARYSAFFAGAILSLFAVIPFYFGIKAMSLISTAGAHHSPLFTALENIAGGTPIVIALCALMAAITSTVDSILCAVSSIICSLIAAIFVNHKKDEVAISQLIIVLCGLIIFVVSHFISKGVITILIDSYEISVACLFISIIAACFKDPKKLKLEAAYLSVGLGFAGFVFSKIHPFVWLKFWGLPLSLALSLIGYLVGDLFIAPLKLKRA